MSTTFQKIASRFDRTRFKTLHEEISFPEFIDRVTANPRLARGAYQRIYDMIMRKGTDKFKKFRKTYTKYKFFDDPEIPIYGLEDTLQELVKFISGAAGGYGTEKRVLLLHGPVGSSKSTICRLLKKGLQEYSQTDEGAWYTYKWVDLPPEVYSRNECICPMNDSPLRLIPEDIRQNFVDDLNKAFAESAKEEDKSGLYTLAVDGPLNPRCNKFMSLLLTRYSGDWQQVIDKHVRVIRIVHSEADRRGIATFQPKDEKNQDATELTGDIDYGQLSRYGSDSDPRAFNFDGEFCCGNGGCVEFIEVLKLAKEFLYDLLGASQERRIKPKKFPQIPLDTMLICHTNNPEYEKLRNDQTMEALRDRTYKIDVPYLRNWSQELQVLLRDYGPNRVKQHIAPHTLEVASLWAVLTRLQEDKDNKLTPVEKVKLYDGRALPGFTEDTVKELMDKYPNEGMAGGVSVRYVQDKISNCLAADRNYISPFKVLNEIRSGLDNSALITNKEEVGKYRLCVDYVMRELDEILKEEVQKALVGDEKAIIRLCTNYIDNMMAYIQKSKVKNPYTGKDQEPDERLMRSIEEKIDIPEVQADDFRREVSIFIGALARQNKTFEWNSNPRLEKALKAKLFEDTKDHIKLSALNMEGASVVNPEMQEKIDQIKARLIKHHGYTDESATDVLNYVGSIFARGDVSGDD